MKYTTKSRVCDIHSFGELGYRLVCGGGNYLIDTVRFDVFRYTDEAITLEITMIGSELDRFGEPNSEMRNLNIDHGAASQLLKSLAQATGSELVERHVECLINLRDAICDTWQRVDLPSED